jgi:hypothetical protein
MSNDALDLRNRPLTQGEGENLMTVRWRGSYPQLSQQKNEGRVLDELFSYLVLFHELARGNSRWEATWYDLCNKIALKPSTAQI